MLGRYKPLSPSLQLSGIGIVNLSKRLKMGSTSLLRIFLVNDNLFCLKMYELYLGVLGYKDLTLCRDGNSCLDSLARQPDVIFLDYSMETAGDCQLLKRIKQHNPDIYVVFLCSPEKTEETKLTLKQGAFDYIIKGERDLDDMKNMLSKIKNIKELLNNPYGLSPEELFLRM